MISEFVQRFDARRDEIRTKILDHHPSYEELVKYVVEAIYDDDNEYSYEELPDPTRITTIDDGDYQGTYVYVIGATGYQPSTYYYTMVSYGSCSGCDTLSAIYVDYDYDGDDYNPEDTVNTRQADAYFDVALHLFQRMRRMYDTALERNA